MKKFLAFLFVAAMAVALVACGGSDSEEGQGEGGEESEALNPDKLVMGFVPSQDSGEIAETAQPLADKLGEVIGKEVEAKTMTSYSALVEALGNDTVHIGFLPAFGYVLADSKYEVEVLLKSERNGSATYVAQYLVRADSPVESLDDLEEHAGDMIWAYGDASSTSGYLFPASQLMSKFELESTTALQEEFFAGTMKSGGHDNSAVAVLEGQADIATTFDDVRDTMLEDYPSIKEDLKVIGTTEEIPNDTVTVPASLDDELTKEIQDAFLSFNDDEEMIKIMNEVYNWDAIIKAESSDYDVVRETYNNLGGDIPLD
ncbi:phosphate/phosphite/phosphonate ABC transporter substrate-binding protein [Salinibacillus xinjiangensis]|uniref:Phosphate/phosphite/phosphonate ABC transporter substrate-binding protein n=1 Tax=Salinibacillus xinjiangensis TaxID=1229268 RepID=A0A6G1X819_9BACI|nr:phosphate/phosphite/phosphonate ABC transporter substrate-binding protein [Salinibacillus xinjiangensis]MRG87056.1 phosphate/phosphite/phosphonate ABC transporter substrate-binding protein [Salinibacillus xinjiangensis]